MYDHIAGIWAFIATALFTGGLAVYAAHYRNVPGAWSYAIHKAAISLMLTSLIIASVSSDSETKIFWVKAFHLFIGTAVLAWLVLTIELNGYGKWLRMKYISAICIIPVTAFILIFTGESGFSFFSGFWMDGDNLRGSYGLAGNLSMSLGYLVLLLSVLMFLNRFLKIKGVMRTQAGILIVSTCITMAGHFAWRFGPSPDFRQDMLAITFFISGCLDVFALFHLKMFDIVTAAQNAVMQTMGEGLAVLDSQGFIIGINPAVGRIIGKTGQEILGKSAAGIFKLLSCELPDFIENSQNRNCEIIMGGKWFNVLKTRVLGSNNRFLGKALVFHDITDRKKAQERLLEQEHALAVMKERERLGRELHDGQGQLAGYFQMQLEAVRSYIANGHSEQAEPILKQLIQQTQGLNTEIRESIFDLKSSGADGSILSILDEYLKWFERNYGIETGFAVTGNYSGEIISPLAAVQVQRIIQEALANVRKHANARHAEVKINISGHAAEITIEDDGTGFNPEKALQKVGSYGLRIMRERAEEIGAEFHAFSGMGTGTVISIRVPLIEEQRDHKVQ